MGQNAEIFDKEDQRPTCKGSMRFVTGGFGERGKGKSTATFAREHKIPYLGICLGMQMAVIKAAILRA